MKTVLQLFFALIIFLYSTDIIKANQVIYQQDFSNSSELENWKIIQNNGDNRWGVCLDTAAPANWQINNGWIGIILDGTSCTTIISPKKRIDLAPHDTYIFEVDLRLDESVNMDRNILFAYQDENNWYDIKLYGSGLNLEKVVNGKSYSLVNSQTTFPFRENQTYHFTIIYSSNSRRILVYIDNQLTIDSIDAPPYLSKSFSFGIKTALGGGRSVSFFDNINIYTDDKVLGSVDEDDSQKSIIVPVVKQTNKEWAETEYDHASNWSEKNPTIKRWGCALSSMVSVLKYYGINLLPSGKIISPLTLNEWLNEQPDGYVGDGLLNWLAVTRLTRQISDLHGTPKLEFSRVIENSLQPTIEQIDLLRPTILNIVGHFLVGNGYKKSLDDLIITDPAYEYENFSQHKSELLSTLIFTPSYTDLSYIQIVTDENIFLEIKDSKGKTITTTYYTESLGSYDGEVNNSLEVEKEIKRQKIYLIPKPKSDQYQLSFTNNNSEEIKFSLYSYDQLGNASIYDNRSETDFYAVDYNFNYIKKENSSREIEISKIVSWENFSQNLNHLLSNKSIDDYVNIYSQKIINLAKAQTTPDQKRYVSLLINYLTKVINRESIKQSLITDLHSLQDSI